MKGICAFDIDNTLTCGYSKCRDEKIESMIQSIEYCKSKDMRIVINTARPPQKNILFNIQENVLQALGEDVEVYNMARENTHVPLNKLQNHILMSNKHNVPFSNVILIDDRKDTCDMLAAHGAPTVHVSGDKLGFGISNLELSLLKSTIHELENYECTLRVFKL